MEVALKLFAEKGYHLASVDEIAAKSNVSKGGLYFHFPSKKDLFKKLLEEYGSRLVEKVQEKSNLKATSKEKVEAIFEEIVNVFVRYSALAKFLLIESCSANSSFEAERQKVIDNLEKVVADTLKEADPEELALKIDPQLAASFFCGGVYHVIISALIKGEIEKIEREKDKIKSFLISQIFKEGK